MCVCACMFTRCRTFSAPQHRTGHWLNECVDLSLSRLSATDTRHTHSTRVGTKDGLTSIMLYYIILVRRFEGCDNAQDHLTNTPASVACLPSASILLVVSSMCRAYAIQLRATTHAIICAGREMSSTMRACARHGADNWEALLPDNIRIHNSIQHSMQCNTIEDNDARLRLDAEGEIWYRLKHISLSSTRDMHIHGVCVFVCGCQSSEPEKPLCRRHCYAMTIGDVSCCSALAIFYATLNNHSRTDILKICCVDCASLEAMCGTMKPLR